MRAQSLTDLPFGTKLTSRVPPQREVAVIVRGRYRLRPGQPVAPIEQGALTADRFAEGDDERTGECLYPSDFAEAKRGAEVMLRGTCHAPGGRPVIECPVRFTVGAWSKTLHVVGRRTWVERGRAVVPSAPEGFVRMPLGYANAYGGPGFPANPVGRGIAGNELPNVELPSLRIQSPKDRVLPAGFGPINPAWSPRSGKVGKAYGEAWRKSRAPFYAEDFDWSYFHAAPLDQQLPHPLRGDERIGFENLHPAMARFSVELPGVRIRAFLRTAEPDLFEAPMALDTLFADLDEETLTLTWRGHGPVREDDLADVRTLFIASERLDEPPRPFGHYRALVEAFEADPFQREKVMPPGAKALMAAARTGEDGAPRPPADVISDIVGGAAASHGGDVKAAADGALAQMRAGMQRFETLKAAANANGGAPPTGAVAAGGLAEKLAGALDRMKALRAQMPGETSPADAARFDALLANPALARAARPPSRVEPGPGRDLSERDFNGCDLAGRDLSGANLRGAHLMKAKLRGARLTGANLREAVLAQADLEGADLTDADLTKAMLAEANLRSATLSRALLDQAHMGKADLSGATLDQARGERVLFLEAKLGGARAQAVRFSEAMFLKADMEDADFRFAHVVRSMFFEVRGRRIQLSRAMLYGSSFSKSDLSDADITEVAGERTVWRGATLDRADLRWSQLSHANFDEALLRRTKLSAANLRGASFYRATLDGAEFVKTNLLGANLAKASLARASFLGANMYEANLRGAAGEDTTFTNANLKRAVFDPS